MASYPSFAPIGTQTNGRPARLNRAVVDTGTIDATFAYVRAVTGVDLSSRIVQAQGGAVLSAGTHADGCALDLRTRGLSRATIEQVVAALRECGWVAWYRDWPGNQHIHAAANLGSGYSTRVLYQVRAARAGYNGLGAGGRGGPDPHPAPSQWRTVQQGVTWARTHTPGPTPTPTPQEDDMPLTPQDLNDIANLSAERTTRAVLEAWLGQTGPTLGAAVQMAAAGSNTTAQLAGRVAGLEAAVEQLARGGGIDPAVITRAVRDGLAGAQVTVELGGGQSA